MQSAIHELSLQAAQTAAHWFDYHPASMSGNFHCHLNVFGQIDCTGKTCSVTTPTHPSAECRLTGQTEDGHPNNPDNADMYRHTYSLKLLNKLAMGPIRRRY